MKQLHESTSPPRCAMNTFSGPTPAEVAMPEDHVTYGSDVAVAGRFSPLEHGAVVACESRAERLPEPLQAPLVTRLTRN
jgi:hypothetical protein